jgi:catechol 2,3-dioxygenase-like lactoylglutathione lyase family enzyme
MPKMSDWGGVHLAFYVDDMEAALAYLEDVEGVRIVGGAKETMGIEVGESELDLRSSCVVARRLRGRSRRSRKTA